MGQVSILRIPGTAVPVVFCWTTRGLTLAPWCVRCDATFTRANRMEDYCESCRQAPVAVVEALDDPAEPYRLCRDCFRRLEAHSLRPLEWYRLCAVHGPNSDSLSGLYYDEESGKALQPSEPVIDAASLPCPLLEEVAGRPSDLLTYVLSRQHLHEGEQITSWYVSEELVDALKRHSPEVWQATPGARLAEARNPEISGVIFHLIGLTLGPRGAGLIRENWARFAGTSSLWNMAFAASRCLPVTEAHQRVTDALAGRNLPERMAAKLILLEFTTPLTLDWIEKNIQSPVDITWGLLAASSSFDWPRAEKWLDWGRPLSLVALDALEWCVCSGRKPPLLHPPPPAEFVRRLEDYRSKDPVLRVRERVERLVEFLRPQIR
jgi:hypothetical protein